MFNHIYLFLASLGLPLLKGPRTSNSWVFRPFFCTNQPTTQFLPLPLRFQLSQGCSPLASICTIPSLQNFAALVHFLSGSVSLWVSFSFESHSVILVKVLEEVEANALLNLPYLTSYPSRGLPKWIRNSGNENCLQTWMLPDRKSHVGCEWVRGGMMATSQRWSVFSIYSALMICTAATGAELGVEGRRGKTGGAWEEYWVRSDFFLLLICFLPHWLLICCKWMKETEKYNFLLFHCFHP